MLFTLCFDHHASKITTITKSETKANRRNKKKMLKILQYIVRRWNRSNSAKMFYTPTQKSVKLRVPEVLVDSFSRKYIIIDSAAATPTTTDTETHYFAPWIYAYCQKSVRFIVRKLDDALPTPATTPTLVSLVSLVSAVPPVSTYLVHRSFPNRELQHPGGHIEYTEYDDAGREVTAKPYVEQLFCGTGEIEENAEILEWIFLGGVRELQEESGLDLSSYYDRSRLIKNGTKTYYFAIDAEKNLTEKGPLPEFEREIIVSHADDDEPKNELDKFWVGKVDFSTNHAWITLDEMRKYWNPSYLDHIDALGLAE